MALIVVVIIGGSSATVYVLVVDSGAEVSYETILLGGWCGFKDAQNLVITDNVTWSDLWIEINSISSSPPPLPYVNFMASWVVAVFLGNRSSGGYIVNITKVGRTLFSYKVYFDELHNEGGVASTVFIQPFQIVKISGVPLDLPVEFVYRYVSVS
jgi:hypothetical protein